MKILLSSQQQLVRSAQGFCRRFQTVERSVVQRKVSKPTFYAEQQHLAKPPANRKTGIVICNDRGSLRLQFPSNLSKTYWKKTQKYLYLGLVDTPKNREFAELLVCDLELDIGAGCLDQTGERYLQTVQAYKSDRSKQRGTSPTKFLTTLFKRETVSSLFDKYCEYRKASFAETTIKEEYGRFRRHLSKCPQDLDDGLKIQSYIVAHHAPCRARRLIGVIANAVEWGKLNRLLPADFLNVYKQYRKDILEISQRETAQSIQALIHAGLMDTDDLEFRAFTPAEATAIIEAIQAVMCHNNRCGTPWDLVVEFLFRTGCRPGECAGLKWGAVSADCSKITFKSSYSYRSRVLKGVKTQGKGSASRTFPCGAKLQGLLLSIRPATYDFDAFVFANRKGEPINFSTFHPLWVGSQKKGIVGVLPTLIKEGKVQQYLPPYRTRHTYINAQLRAGVSPAYVAKLVGNTPATIHQYYESIFRDEVQPIEF